MFFFFFPSWQKWHSCYLCFFVNAVENRSWAWAGWRSYELCANLFFCLRLCSFPFSCRHFSDFSLPQRRSHQWFLLFGVDIPNVSLFIYCISAITERLCWGWVKHATMDKSQYRSQGTARKRDVKHFRPALSVGLVSSHKGFHFKLYHVEKNKKKLLSQLSLTASWRRWWFVKD